MTLLVLHILSALGSLLLAGAAVLRPNSTLLRSAQIGAATTLSTGTLLVILAPSNLVTACISGIIYLAFAFSLTKVASHRLETIAAK